METTKDEVLLYRFANVGSKVEPIALKQSRIFGLRGVLSYSGRIESEENVFGYVLW